MIDSKSNLASMYKRTTKYVPRYAVIQSTEVPAQITFISTYLYLYLLLAPSFDKRWNRSRQVRSMYSVPCIVCTLYLPTFQEVHIGTLLMISGLRSTCTSHVLPTYYLTKRNCPLWRPMTD